MANSNPVWIKHLGKIVKGFDQTAWEDVRYQFMKRGIRAKFAQNESLKKKLLATGEDTLCECSRYDTVWGNGLSKIDPKLFDKKHWRGQNLLGQILGEVREELRGSR